MSIYPRIRRITLIVVLAPAIAGGAQHVPNENARANWDIRTAGSDVSPSDGDGMPPPWTFFPLEVGSVWEYSSESMHSVRVEIFRDTTITGDVYVEWTRYHIDPVGNVSSMQNYYIRYDSTTATIAEWSQQHNNQVPFIYSLCPLDGKLNEVIDCSGIMSADVIGMGSDGSIAFSDTTLVNMFHKTYDSMLGWSTYFSELGVVQEITKDGFGYKWLTYYRDQDNEYGDENFPVGSEPDVSVPPLLTLGIYPNPTAGSFTAALSLPEAAHVRIEVFDVLGRRVATLSNDRYAGGEHGIQLQTGHLPAGLYVVRAEVTPDSGAPHVFTRRVTVVR